jgi:2'-5' RNA ligase
VIVLTPEELNNAALKKAAQELVERMLGSGEALAFTLTLKQGIWWMERNARRWVRLTREIVDGELSQFLNRVNRAVLKNQFRRGGKRLRSFCTVERGQQGRKGLHVHGAIEVPRDIDPGQFRVLLMRAWIKSRWGRVIHRFKPVYDSLGWTGYCTKAGLDAVRL